jgi:hypothetical protein
MRGGSEMINDIIQNGGDIRTTSMSAHMTKRRFSASRPDLKQPSVERSSRVVFEREERRRGGEKVNGIEMVRENMGVTYVLGE